jgi:hypothetical protein
MTGGPFTPNDEIGAPPRQHRTANEESGPLGLPLSHAVLARLCDSIRLRARRSQADRGPLFSFAVLCWQRLREAITVYRKCETGLKGIQTTAAHADRHEPFCFWGTLRTSFAPRSLAPPGPFVSGPHCRALLRTEITTWTGMRQRRRDHPERKPGRATTP